LGVTRREVGGSEWATRHGLRDGRPPVADPDVGRLLHELVAGLVIDRMVSGLHDCSDGGVAVALAEMAITGGVGFNVRVGDAMMCFSESASRVVLSVAPDRINEVLGRAGSGRVPSVILGDAGGDDLHADGAFHVPLAEAEHAWRDALPSIMGSPPDVG
jgi:phosphoribosylformylglycinamidine synthase subunit PurL